MDLASFLYRTDEITSRYTKNQLIAFIHDLGRTLPEEERQEFLLRLESIGEQSDKDDKESTSPSSMEEMHHTIGDNLDLIDTNVYSISEVTTDSYDDWYGRDNRFAYRDVYNISEKLKEACRYVHTCMEKEQFQSGYEIGRKLFSTRVLCLKEGGTEEFDLQAMVSHRLLDIDLKKVALDVACCTYRANGPETRCEALYEVIKSFRMKEITLEAILQHAGRKLPDFPDFLPDWIDYIGHRIDYDADRLIYEAEGLLFDDEKAVEYADKFGDVHPGIYIRLLNCREGKDVSGQAELGLRALNRIPKNFLLRSHVALRTAEYMKASGYEQTQIEQCYFDAYESATTAQNYLRALLHGYGSPEKRHMLNQVFTDLPFSRDGVRTDSLDAERQENTQSACMHQLLEFFSGHFSEAVEESITCSNDLDSSMDFIRPEISLYLLYIYEGSEMGRAMQTMVRYAESAVGFSASEYLRGACEPEDTMEEGLFLKVFREWKAMTPMSPEVRSHILSVIPGMISRRTEDMMEDNRRKLYAQSAAYIAALGEVRESLGDPGAKQELMVSYVKKYNRRSAFRNEMTAFGLERF